MPHSLATAHAGAKRPRLEDRGPRTEVRPKRRGGSLLHRLLRQKPRRTDRRFIPSSLHILEHRSRCKAWQAIGVAAAAPPTRHAAPSLRAVAHHTRQLTGSNHDRTLDATAHDRSRNRVTCPPCRTRVECTARRQHRPGRGPLQHHRSTSTTSGVPCRSSPAAASSPIDRCASSASRPHRRVSPKRSGETRCSRPHTLMADAPRPRWSR